MTYGTTPLNPGAGGDEVLNDALTSLDGAAPPAGAIAQVVKMVYGAQGQAKSITDTQGMPVSPVSAFFWRVGFAEVSASGLAGLSAAEMTLLKTGAGMTVSQSGGNLLIATGTTANAETVLRSNVAFHGALLARYKAILSQRIANQTFRFELADLVGSGLAYTINSATSVTVAFPTGTNPYTAANVGQSLRLAVLSSVGIPGRWAIASVSGDNVTFTVAAWPASGSGTLTLYGHNWLQAEYSGTTATNLSFDAQRRGWNSGNTSVSINTTAAPGHVGQISTDVMTAGCTDALVASNAGFQFTGRGSRIENIPDEDIDLYFFVVAQNGSTAPASTTTLTVGFLSVEDQPRNKVRFSGADPATSHPMPVQVMNPVTTVTANQGTMVALPAGANAVGDFGVQYRANATGGASGAHIVSAATVNATIVKASAGRVVGWNLSNTTASWVYVKLHNLATLPTAGAAVARSIGIPPNGSREFSMGGGIAFTTGIGLTTVTGSADADATAVAAGAIVGDLFFA